jgi:hypothetical protein
MKKEEPLADILAAIIMGAAVAISVAMGKDYIGYGLITYVLMLIMVGNSK